jgi:hypothetical protein
MKPIGYFQSVGPTNHFKQRARERGLGRDVEDFIITWGTQLEARDNAYYFTVLERELPGEVRWSRLARRAANWVLVVSEQGDIITCYRDRNAWRTVRRRRTRIRIKHKHAA